MDLNPTTTLEVSNFGGRLTRVLNGDINSGFAKFVSSWGYDPFSKPMNLTWLETPTDISTGITDMMVAAKPFFDGSTSLQYIYGVGSQGKIYKIQTNSISNPNVDSVVLFNSVIGDYSFGASIDFFGDTEKIYIGHASGIRKVDFNLTNDTQVGTSGYVGNVYRPLKQFIGKLLFGNSNTIGAVDSTGLVTSSIIGMAGSNRYSELNPGLPVDSRITDLDSSEDGNYLLITASGTPNEVLNTVSSDRQASAASNGAVYKWNGTDPAITSFNTIPSYAVTALQTYLQNNVFFSNDSFGSSMSDGVQKILTLPNNKSPFANSTMVNGNFVCWICPEIAADNSTMYASMYYFGSLDQENPPGLYRVMRYTTTLSSGFVYQTPVNLMTNNKYSTVNNALTAIVPLGYGKHYFSTMEISNSTTNYKFYRFLITPTGTGTPQLGAYETQTQIFPKRQTIKQIRVYTEPTATGNGFKVDIIGSDGSVIVPGNGVMSYSYAAGTDITLLQGSLERVNFNPTMLNLFGIGIRITNTGTTNMTIKKIEVDIQESGK